VPRQCRDNWLKSQLAETELDAGNGAARSFACYYDDLDRNRHRIDMDGLIDSISKFLFYCKDK
jgi:hypothetical protein